MTSLHCFLLIAFFFHSCPPFATAQFMLESVMPTGTLGKNVERLANAVYLFTTDLHEKILESDVEANVFFSPTSIYVALAMLYAGSGGKTKSQLASALHLDVFESDENGFYESIKILHQTLSSTEKNYTLKIANRLFCQKGFEIKDEYLEKTDELFRAEMEALDFRKDSSGSRSKINSWVSRMTSEKIKELFPKSGITSDTVLVLANAIYFKGSWLYKFDKQITRPQTFSTSRNKKIKVPMMHLFQSKGLRYSAFKHESVKLLELPYSDKNVSMIIALDDRDSNFDTLLRGEVADISWGELVEVFTNVSIRLSLPKFSLQQTLNLKKSLRALGIKNLFGTADLSGMAESHPLELSEAIHKAFIAVDEVGTEAAAATGLGIQTKSMPSPDKKVIDFIVDQPFLFLVVEKTTGCILFFGHIKNPLKSN